MNILTVDLAAKFSAYQVQDPSGRVLCEGDSRDLSAFDFAARLNYTAKEHSVGFVLIEDVPYAITRHVKEPFRLQGVIMREMLAFIGVMWFINPQTWQKAYPGVARGPEQDRIDAAARHAADLGYTPPDFLGTYLASLPEGTRVLKKNTAPLVKNMTDYVDAFLMGRWAHSFDSLDEVPLQKGVQPPYI